MPPCLQRVSTCLGAKVTDDDNDDESQYKQKKRWNVYDNTDHDHDVNESEELCKIHELSVCNIRRFEMIKYSFRQDEEYVAVKEDEYNDSTRAREDACRAYRDIFCMMDEGWMVTRAK
ncbi:hypothetical protein Tco_0336509 [Tanacetum coccineum]